MFQRFLRQTVWIRGGLFASGFATRSKTGGLSPRPSYGHACGGRRPVVGGVECSMFRRFLRQAAWVRGGLFASGFATRSKTGGLSPRPSYGHACGGAGRSWVASNVRCFDDSSAKPFGFEEVRSPQGLRRARRRAGCRHDRPTAMPAADAGRSWVESNVRCFDDSSAKPFGFEEVCSPQGLRRARRRAGCRHDRPTAMPGCALYWSRRPPCSCFFPDSISTACGVRPRTIENGAGGGVGGAWERTELGCWAGFSFSWIDGVSRTWERA